MKLFFVFILIIYVKFCDCDIKKIENNIMVFESNSFCKRIVGMTAFIASVSMTGLSSGVSEQVGDALGDMIMEIKGDSISFTKTVSDLLCDKYFKLPYIITKVTADALTRLNSNPLVCENRMIRDCFIWMLKGAANSMISLIDSDSLDKKQLWEQYVSYKSLSLSKIKKKSEYFLKWRKICKTISDHKGHGFVEWAKSKYSDVSLKNMLEEMLSTINNDYYFKALYIINRDNKLYINQKILDSESRIKMDSSIFQSQFRKELKSIKVIEDENFGKLSKKINDCIKDYNKFMISMQSMKIDSRRKYKKEVQQFKIELINKIKLMEISVKGDGRETSYLSKLSTRIKSEIIDE